MIRITRTWCTAWLPTLMLAGGPAVAAQPTLASSAPVFESTSSGLITFSREDQAIRVAVVFAQQDDAVVGTVVKFVDAKGNVLKQLRGELRDGEPVVAELTRQDVGELSDLLVRVEVAHKLPGVRDYRYPILVTVQPISRDGSGRFVLDWPGGDCGCSAGPGFACGPPGGYGQHTYCAPNGLTD